MNRPRWTTQRANTPLHARHTYPDSNISLHDDKVKIESKPIIMWLLLICVIYVFIIIVFFFQSDDFIPLVSIGTAGVFLIAYWIMSS